MTATLLPMTRARRVSRRPSHSFSLKHKPYVIQPFMLAPVLPGETMKNLLMQSRVVTDPIQSNLTGWWIEYYFFYVKHRDLTARDEFTSMMIDGSWTPTNVKDDTPDPDYYFHGGTGQNQINWAKLCTARCVEEYFRNEGEAWDDFLIDNMPIASVNIDSWLDSVTNDTDYVSPDINVDLDANATITTSEVERAMQQWEMLRLHGLTDMTYEQYLQTHGVRAAAAEEPHKPELVRFVRDWSYPTNTVDPATGAPSAAVSWTVTERADKDRYFSEPGFLIGLTLSRPKIYFGGQAGNAAAMMNDVYSWLPAVMDKSPFSSLKKMTTLTGPLSASTDDYWVDIRDLFIYGDQFVNYAMSTTGKNIVSLPTAAMQKKYLSAASELHAFFVDSANASGKVYTHQDGIVSLNILGQQRDTTPSMNPGTM